MFQLNFKHFHQIIAVMRLIFDWLMVRQKGKEEWRYALMGFGELYVMIVGMSTMLEWFVGSWDMMDVSNSIIYPYYSNIFTLYFPSTSSFPSTNCYTKSSSIDKCITTLSHG